MGRWRRPHALRSLVGAAARTDAPACVPVLEVAARRGLLMAEKKGELLAELEAVSKMLGGMLKAMNGDGDGATPAAQAPGGAPQAAAAQRAPAK